MDTHFTYLLVDLGCLIFPLLFSFHPKILFYKEWKHILGPTFATATIFIIWDILFTRIGVWGFNPDYVCGIYIFNLPLEEVLFFLCIPYACVFTYYCIRTFTAERKMPTATVVTFILALALISAGALFYDRWYTSVTSFATAVFLLVQLLRKVNYMSTFFVAYILVLPFFFLSNGILTGSFLDAPVVWYNNEENLGIRMFTIPVEDTFYGMLMVLMNVAGYEFVRSRSRES